MDGEGERVDGCGERGMRRSVRGECGGEKDKL